MKLLSWLVAFWNALMGYQKPEDYGEWTQVQRDREKKVLDAQHLLTGNSWRDPAGKEAFVKKVYGNEVPYCLHYAIGDAFPLEEDFQSLAKLFGAEYDNVRLDYSGDREVGRVLKIFRPKIFLAEIEVQGEKCPLYETGFVFFGVTHECPFASFMVLYDTQEAVAYHRHIPRTRNYGCSSRDFLMHFSTIDKYL